MTIEHPTAPPLSVNIAAGIVAAFVTKNALPANDLPGLLGKVHAEVVALSAPGAARAIEPEFAQPSAAEIKASVQSDGLKSFIDGKVYKTLKRHLRTHGLDPYGYRARYGLPADYPIVAASYSAMRSDLAKSIGLGVPGARAA